MVINNLLALKYVLKQDFKNMMIKPKLYYRYQFEI